MRLDERLLSVASGIAADGGELVARRLRESILELGAFEAGEVVAVLPGGPRRWSLAFDPLPLVGDDLLDFVSGSRAPLRIDDLPEAERFPQTHARLLERGLRSLLAVPLWASPEPGVLVVARSFGWGLVGLSMHYAWPLAGIAGLALRASAGLTDLALQVEELSVLSASAPRLAEQAAGARVEAHRIRRDLDREHAELEDLRQAAEASRAEAERWRKAALAADEESARLREELARRPAPPSSLPSPARRNRRRGVTA